MYVSNACTFGFFFQGPCRREKTFQLLVLLLRWFAHENGPMGLVFDNCHDLDASSLSVLQKMVGHLLVLVLVSGCGLF